mmetsp:Transcript_9619/g.27649  ORF Transcript_9619/g.27649 Transcript_9619/m.27649 type:complete len:285 (-) Transcript_9619:263-1117(-)
MAPSMLVTGTVTSLAALAWRTIPMVQVTSASMRTICAMASAPTHSHPVPSTRAAGFQESATGRGWRIRRRALSSPCSRTTSASRRKSTFLGAIRRWTGSWPRSAQPSTRAERAGTPPSPFSSRASRPGSSDDGHSRHFRTAHPGCRSGGSRASILEHLQPRAGRPPAWWPRPHGRTCCCCFQEQLFSLIWPRMPKQVLVGREAPCFARHPSAGVQAPALQRSCAGSGGSVAARPSGLSLRTGSPARFIRRAWKRRSVPTPPFGGVSSVLVRGDAAFIRTSSRAP